MTIAAQEAFIVTVGVPHDQQKRIAHCNRALKVLQQAGYQCGPTSDEAILELAKQVELTQGLAANDPDLEDT